MRVVVADTGPLHYLVLVGQIDLMPGLFGGLVVPTMVHAELLHTAAPDAVRHWAAEPPSWLTISPAPPHVDPTLHRLDRGERAAIGLALSLRADLVLMDDRTGVAVARDKGLTVTGTLGILDLAASRGLIDIAESHPAESDQLPLPARAAERPRGPTSQRAFRGGAGPIAVMPAAPSAEASLLMAFYQQTMNQNAAT